ncbi:hypothetical protein MMC22_005796 [Lobaria immixta]|nr:hypothetical protein [Lobaria immixta]
MPMNAEYLLHPTPHDDNMDIRHPDLVLLMNEVSELADRVESLEEATKAVIKEAIKFMDTMLDQIKPLIERMQQIRHETTILTTDIQDMTRSLDCLDAI